MNIRNINLFRKILIENNKSVSKIEYTKNNYDNTGNLIKKEIPTITTDFCEIGVYDSELYLVFIIESNTFNLKFFNEIKNKSNIKIYRFIDFSKILYPIKKFNYNEFIQIIKKEKYLQIQFDFKNIKTQDLFIEYNNLISIFIKNKIIVINQLKIDLRHK